MTWCDKLASTPAIGFRFTPHHRSSQAILESILPLLDKWAKTWTQGFNIRSQSAFAVDLMTEDGYQYAFDARKMYVEFTNQLKVKAQSGGPPIAELVSPAQKYSDLLPDVSSKVIEAFALINGAKSRPLERIGVVSTTVVSAEDLPPGVTKLIDYMAKPWGGKLHGYSITITGVLGDGDGYVDRCVHTIVNPENPEELMTVKFDWQRSYASATSVNTETLKKLTAAACGSASRYFEELGEGSRFDERILNRTA